MTPCRLDEFNKTRTELNQLMASQDAFFSSFGALDDTAYSDGTIPKVYKELMGLALSISHRCSECITYHVQNSVKEGASKAQIIEAIKIGVIGGGSITYPSARDAFATLRELGMLEAETC